VKWFFKKLCNKNIKWYIYESFIGSYKKETFVIYYYSDSILILYILIIFNNELNINLSNLFLIKRFLKRNFRLQKIREKVQRACAHFFKDCCHYRRLGGLKQKLVVSLWATTSQKSSSWLLELQVCSMWMVSQSIHNVYR
jgi:acyl-ACP thioesterase